MFHSFQDLLHSFQDLLHSFQDRLQFSRSVARLTSLPAHFSRSVAQFSALLAHFSRSVAQFTSPVAQFSRPLTQSASSSVQVLSLSPLSVKSAVTNSVVTAEGDGHVEGLMTANGELSARVVTASGGAGTVSFKKDFPSSCSSVGISRGLWSKTAEKT